jgi:RimJ/RimL family protein N-acetyltransferase
MPSPNGPDTSLCEITDAHFLWLLGKGDPPTPELTLPQGGVEETETLQIVRRMTQRLHRHGSRGSWMMLCGNELVGLCSYKQAPAADGSVEIGYGVAASRRKRGHATRAVAAVLDFARADPAVKTITAATAIANVASQRALERNGFVQSGASHDPDDGEMILWKIEL